MLHLQSCLGVTHVIMAEMKFAGTVEVRIKDKGESCLWDFYKSRMAEVYQCILETSPEDVWLELFNEQRYV